MAQNKIQARRMLFKALKWYQRPVKACNLHLYHQWEKDMMNVMYHDGLIAVHKDTNDRNNGIYLTNKGLELAHAWFPSLDIAHFHRADLSEHYRPESRTYFYTGFDGSQMVYVKDIDLDYGAYTTTLNQNEATWTTDWRDKKEVKNVFGTELHPFETTVYVNDEGDVR